MMIRKLNWVLAAMFVSSAAIAAKPGPATRADGGTAAAVKKTADSFEKTPKAKVKMPKPAKGDVSDANTQGG